MSFKVSVYELDSSRLSTLLNIAMIGKHKGSKQHQQRHPTYASVSVADLTRKMPGINAVLSCVLIHALNDCHSESVMSSVIAIVQSLVVELCGIIKHTTYIGFWTQLSAVAVDITF